MEMFRSKYEASILEIKPYNGIMELYHALSPEYEKCHQRHPYYFVFENLDTGEQHDTIGILSSPLIYTKNVLSSVYKGRRNFLTEPIDSNLKPDFRDSIRDVLEKVRSSIDFFSGTWAFRIVTVNPHQHTPTHLKELTGENWDRDETKYNSQQWSDRVCETLFPRFIKRNASNISKAQAHLEQTIRTLMTTELPKIRKMEELLEALVRVEGDYQTKFEALTAHYETKLTQALEAQRTGFEQRLSEAESSHQKQLIDMHETISQLQDMIDKTYQQNELLLEAQKQQAKNYEGQLFGLLEKLKDA